ncbi:MAG TPA: hypothetical protein VNJ04_21350 [Gemmatimonadaceae bacterium]|nr:hypothetical protein [Gemmatimonadaceae bacterium]
MPMRDIREARLYPAMPATSGGAMDIADEAVAEIGQREDFASYGFPVFQVGAAIPAIPGGRPDTADGGDR